MKFEYISIATVIADIRAEMKKLDQSGVINDEDCLNWIIECMRDIGGANYMTEPIVLHVKNNVAVLPDNFYKVKDIWLCNAEVKGVSKIGGIWFTEEGINYYPCSILYPGNTMTGNKYCFDSTVRASSNDQPTYIIQHPKRLRCGIATCTIGLNFLSIPKDDTGYLIQDEIHTLKAVKAFTIIKLVKENYISGQLAKFIYDDLKNDYDVELDLAQAIMKFNDPADDKARGAQQNHRYDAFKLR